MQLSLLRENFALSRSDWHIDMQLLLPVLALLPVPVPVNVLASSMLIPCR